LALRLLVLVSSLVGSAHAELLPLFHAETSLASPGGAKEWINRARSFYVWQNERGLRDYYVKRFSDGSGITRLCVPSTVGNAFLNEYSRPQNPASNLKLPGLSVDGRSVESSDLVEGLAKRCGGETQGGGFEPIRTVDCIKSIYEQSGYSNSRVILIRDYGTQTPAPGVEYIERAPSLDDLQEALREGYQVIASIAFMQWNSATGAWTKVSSHAVNVVGYNRMRSDGYSSMNLYIQNPSRRYDVNFKDPIFDEIRLEDQGGRITRPGDYSSIEVTGSDESLVTVPGARTFLAGLILLKAR